MIVREAFHDPFAYPGVRCNMACLGADLLRMGFGVGSHQNPYEEENAA